MLCMVAALRMAQRAAQAAQTAGLSSSTVNFLASVAEQQVAV
jgi:hypothetical protein